MLSSTVLTGEGGAMTTGSTIKGAECTQTPLQLFFYLIELIKDRLRLCELPRDGVPLQGRPQLDIAPIILRTMQEPLARISFGRALIGAARCRREFEGPQQLRHADE